MPEFSATAPKALRHGNVSRAITTLAILASAFLVPYAWIMQPQAGLMAVAVVLAVGLLAADRTALAVLAVPGVLITTRLAGDAVSGSDAVLTAGALTAVAGGAAQRLGPQARLLMRCLAVYLLLLCVSLVTNGELRGVLEWFHRISLVGGSVVAGVWLVHTGRHVLALRLLLLAMTGLAIATVVESVASGFQAVYPLGYHKNFAGSLLATSLLTVVAAPSAFRLAPTVRYSSVLLLGLGLLATQSRGGLTAVAVGGLVLLLRMAPDERRKKLPVLVLLIAVAGGVAYNSVQTQLAGSNRHDSIDHRFEVETATRLLWLAEPVAGVGLRYYSTPEYRTYQPPNNVLNETLAESGFVGLVGFGVLVVGSLVALRRAPGELAVAGLCVTASRFTHGMVDIYWVAGTSALPWLIAGMGLAGVTTAPLLPSGSGKRSAQALPTATNIGGGRSS